MRVQDVVAAGFSTYSCQLSTTGGSSVVQREPAAEIGEEDVDFQEQKVNSGRSLMRIPKK